MVETKAPADLVNLRERLKAISADILWLADAQRTDDDGKAVADEVYTIAKSVDKMIASRTTKAYTENSESMVKFLRGVVGAVEADASAYAMIYDDNRRDSGWNLSWEQPRECMTSCIVGQIDSFPVNVQLRLAIVGGQRILFYHGCSLVVHHDMIRNFLDIALPATARDRYGRLNREDAENWRAAILQAREASTLAT